MSLANASDLINSWSANGGSLDATNISTIQGSASDIESLYTSSGITGLGNEDITFFYSTPTAALLKRIDNYTSGTINAQYLTTIKGKASDLIII